MNNKFAVTLLNISRKNRLVAIASIQAALLTIRSLHTGFGKRNIEVDANISHIILQDDQAGGVIMTTVKNGDPFSTVQLLAAGFPVIDPVVGTVQVNDVVKVAQKLAHDSALNHGTNIILDLDRELERLEKLMQQAVDDATSKMDKLAAKL